MTAPEPPKPPYKHCLDCGYILSGLPGKRCPECGREFDPELDYTYFTYVESGSDCLFGALLALAFMIVPPVLTILLGIMPSYEYGCTLLFFEGIGLILAFRSLIGGIRRLRRPPEYLTNRGQAILSVILLSIFFGSLALLAAVHHFTNILR